MGLAVGGVRSKLASSRRRTRSHVARHEELMGWVLASPWILGFILWTAGPMLATIGLAFTSWDLLRPVTFVGLDNFATMFLHDPKFWTSLRVTTIYSVVSVPAQIALGLFVAILLNARISGLQWLRTVYYLPAVISGVAVSLLWLWIFSADWGILNYLIGALFGIRGPAWLSDEHWALWALIIMSLWGIGGSMVVYLGGLQGVPTELYEAAEVDGAGRWRKFWSIMIPMISPVIFFQLITGIINALQTFTQGYIMTSGGPNDATLFYVLYLYRSAFRYFRMGYASALAWVIFVYILLLTLLVFRSSSAWVYYAGER